MPRLGLRTLLIVGLTLLLSAGTLALVRQTPPVSPLALYELPRCTGLAEGDWQTNGQRVQLTTPLEKACSGVYGPEGRWVYFRGLLGGQWDLFRVQRRTGRIQQLTQTLPVEHTPVLSPDGRWLAYITSIASRNLRLYIMETDGSDPHPLTRTAFDHRFPSFSPDGQWVVFVSVGRHDEQLYKVRRDGRDAQPLTNVPGRKSTPSFSPDGAWIVFAAQTGPAGPAQVYRVRNNGTDLQPLTSGPSASYAPRYTPDGAWIVFLSNRSSREELYRMRSNGSDVQQLTDSPAYTAFSFTHPRPTPDGGWFLYGTITSNSRGLQRAYRIPVDGGSSQMLGNYASVVPFPILDRPWHAGRLSLTGLVISGLAGGGLVWRQRRLAPAGRGRAG